MTISSSPEQSTSTMPPCSGFNPSHLKPSTSEKAFWTHSKGSGRALLVTGLGFEHCYTSRMVFAENAMKAALIAPLLVILSALSLSVLQRGIEWVASIAHTPQAGMLRKMKPFIKKLDLVIVRIMGENKFEVTTTEILLMGIVIVVLVSVFENADRPKVVVANKKDKKKD